MTLRLINAVFDDGHTATVQAALEPLQFIDAQWSPADERNHRRLRVLLQTEDTQELTDILQTILGGGGYWRVDILPVEATIPAVGEFGGSNTSREELYEDVAAGADLNGNFVLLTVLSVVVACIGVNQDNVAVVIAAMVIAPLLGPNLALALGAGLGDLKLVRRALRTNVIGLGMTLILAAALGGLFEPNLDSAEIVSRTRVGVADLALALAAGAAAVLSVTSGLSGTMVGVMVAIALMPPAVVAGFLTGGGYFDRAGGALLLLTVNVVCLNLAGQLVLIWKGVRPRTRSQIRAASTSVRINLAAWAVMLIILTGVVVFVSW